MNEPERIPFHRPALGEGQRMAVNYLLLLLLELLLDVLELPKSEMN